MGIGQALKFKFKIINYLKHRKMNNIKIIIFYEFIIKLFNFHNKEKIKINK